MSNIRELSFDEIAQVSGGGANGQDASDRNYGGSKSSGRSGGWGAPATTANNAGFVIIGGVLTAVATGIGGPIAGTVVGTAFAAASQSLPNDSNNNKGGGSWHDTNPGGMVGECRW
ncbi:hypothetical protein L369_04747 [Enterobacter sp. MGH 23]|uniref:hypothetical protein n=1 Tax=Enterobacter cloacae complex TaxID=354276 RepID=UPI0003BEFF68|nr:MULTISPECIES: hypothetical protein [Enterobacter cloacae complex]ESN20206.1 hypothetical protein L369_04747 [Enterobacter sp. MGH 23]MCK7301405.1 hypothetical protein [Enterobacter asburiae]MDK9986169.1 hypothetical protein [Enterobacter asburiae]MDK9995375.1 hypothetical protein [Enterobacter asburiae]